MASLYNVKIATGKTVRFRGLTYNAGDAITFDTDQRFVQFMRMNPWSANVFDALGNAVTDVDSAVTTAMQAVKAAWAASNGDDGSPPTPPS